MKALQLLLLLTIAISWCSCKPTTDGHYVIYKVQPDYPYFDHWLPGENDTIRTLLKHRFMGKQLGLTFHENYVNLSLPSNSHELVLVKELDRDGLVYYNEEIKKGEAVVTFRLRNEPNKGFLLAVDMRINRGAALTVPIQLGSRILGERRSARVVCYLERIERP